MHKTFRHFTEADTQIYEFIINRCERVQIKTTMRHYFTFKIMDSIKRTEHKE